MKNRDLYKSIVRLNESAVYTGQFEVSYHLLSAALHAAEAAGDRERIEAVIRLAGQQASAIDAEPDRPPSTQHAAQRDSTPLFESLAATARTKLARIDARRVIGDRRGD